MSSSLWVAVASVLLPLAGGDGAASTTSAVEILDRLQKRYDAIRDFRAEFSQTSFVASLDRKEVSSGTVVVQRPGRMRWEYRSPEHRVIVIDGRSVRIYSSVDRQLQVAPLVSGSVSPTALGFLLGQAILREAFDAHRIAESPRGEIGLKLVPREDSGFEFLELWLEPESLQLRESLLVDLFGNRTRVRFDRIRENTGVKEGDFTIKVPDDTDVIDLR